MSTDDNLLVQIAAGIVCTVVTMALLGILLASVGGSLDPTIGFLLSLGIVLLLFRYFD